MSEHTQDQQSWPRKPAGKVPARPRQRKEGVVRRVGATAAFLADASRRRPAGRRVLKVVIVLLTLGGVAMLSYPSLTHLWAKRIQTRLERTFQTHSVEEVEAYRKKEIKPGEALTKLIIPRLGVTTIVVEGTSGNALRAGAGHYEGTPLPGEPGNVAIAGHRTGFGQPFRNIDKLKQGDEIVLETPLGRYTYKVVGPFDGHPNPWVTFPTDFTVLTPTPDASLTLTTCDPPHTSTNRLIVRAMLVKSEIPT